MTGFSAEWLALREPADQKARNPHVLAACAGHFEARDSLRITDLGCGTGSSLRALAPHLSPRQFWRLVDHDPALLAAARVALVGWADAAQDNGPGLLLEKQGRTLQVEFCEADLAGDVDRLLNDVTDLVTAAALFDLCSPAWIKRFLARLALQKAALCTVLTYNGEEKWTPPHPGDATMLTAFIAHQQTDKGFGPASGPDAPACLIEGLRAHHYGIVIGDSPWQLGAGEAGLIMALADGSAAAVAQTGRVAGDVVEDWRLSRRQAKTCEIGHTDLFACIV